MYIEVILTGTPHIRQVWIPMKDYEKAQNMSHLVRDKAFLELAFEHGQNGKFPSPVRSVSVGDVIIFDDDYFLILDEGFQRMEHFWVNKEIPVWEREILQ